MMSKSYPPWTLDQPYLLPPSLRDWLAEDHLAWWSYRRQLDTLISE